MNPFPHSADNKRYYTWNHYLKTTYHQKVFKVSLDAGFSCPHRDINGQGGCTFCSFFGSGEFAGNRLESLAVQMQKQILMMQKKWPSGLPIAYFQAFTNTYAAISKIKEIYDPFFDGTHDCVAVAIATRADCLNDEIIAYLQSKTPFKDVYLEIGVQTIHEKTSNFINRGHTLSIVEEILKRLSATDIKVVLHIINGLPYEDADMMLQTARWVSKQPIFGLKIHMLHILKNTVLANQHQKQPFTMLTIEEYIDIVIRQLEVIPQPIVIQRLTGDANPPDLITPEWTIRKVNILNKIDQEMVKRDTWQGKHYVHQY